jgi:uncharacterized protein (TIGR03435 family)
MHQSICLIWISALCAAQSAFEVASVRRTPPANIGYTVISPSGAGTFRATNVSLEFLIGFAFRVDSGLIIGKQSWLTSEHYDVIARPEGDKALTYDELRPLLQRLLADRFKLAVHRETKDGPGFALVIAKDGAKLTPSKGGSGQPMILPGGIRAENVSLDTLAAMLARPAGHKVLNKTGIDGKFDFKLDYAPDGATDSPLPSVFTALQEQSGLRLVPQKLPVETLVIDHVEKIPTEN